VSLHIYKWGFWIRINGKGFSIDWDRRPLFSERYGLRRVRRWWRLSFEVL
jgi:hypothetical protein